MNTNAVPSPMFPGVPLALGSAVLFGASAPLSKLLLATVNAWLLAGILYLSAGIGLAISHFGRGLVGLPSVETPLQGRDVPWLSLVFLFGGVLGPLLLMFGLSLTSAATGSLLLSTSIFICTASITCLDTRGGWRTPFSRAHAPRLRHSHPHYPDLHHRHAHE